MRWKFKSWKNLTKPFHSPSPWPSPRNKSGIFKFFCDWEREFSFLSFMYSSVLEIFATPKLPAASQTTLAYPAQQAVAIVVIHQSEMDVALRFLVIQ